MEPIRRAAAAAVILLAACQVTVPSAAVPSGSTSAQLSASAGGLCLALAALPDIRAAQRAFDNHAHGALHELAAAPGLDRDLSARILEAMERVETDFGAQASAQTLGRDLQMLAASTGDALRAVGVASPPCD